MRKSTLLNKLRTELRKVADPSKAEGMRAYMKSTMPYLGVQTVPLRRVCKQVFADVELVSEAQWRKLVLEIWRNAKYREERHAAINLLEDRRARDFPSPRTLKLYEELIVSGAWWDFVDVIASHCVGRLLQGYPSSTRRSMLTWSRSSNMWKRRTAILCQLGAKRETDAKFLYACIEPSLDSKEFFLQKAIGWALRQYARTDPKEVRRYVRAHASRLSALSKREALKNL